MFYMHKFKNIFRVESTRLKEWDYSNPWWYYVTICTNNHFPHFGEINDGKMELNELGKTAVKFWTEIPNHFKNTELDCFVVMPNHIHGIIIITGKEETPCMASLGNIIGKFKGAVTRWAMNNNYINFKWQTRFYDRIIRGEKELFNIRKYIEENPVKWEGK